MFGKLWVCEDNQLKYNSLRDRVRPRYAPLHLKTAADLQARLVAGEIGHDDVVVVDSEMAVAGTNAPEEDVAGIWICASIRSARIGCLLIWNSSVSMPEEVRRLGGSSDGMPQLRPLLDSLQNSPANEPPTQEIVDHANRTLERLSASIDQPFTPFVPLQILCEGYLVIAAGWEDRSELARNPVAMALPQLSSIETLSGRTARLVGNTSEPGWFDAALPSLKNYAADLAEGRLPANLVKLKAGSEAQDRLDIILKSDETGTLEAIQSLGQNDSVYGTATQSVGKLCELLHAPETNQVPPPQRTAYEVVRRGYLGLRLLAMVHL